MAAKASHQKGIYGGKGWQDRSKYRKGNAENGEIGKESRRKHEEVCKFFGKALERRFDCRCPASYRGVPVKRGIIKIENSDILGMVHEFGLSPDALYELIVAAKKNPLPVSNPISNETEEEANEE